ncbi:MAG: hypothetical protein K9N48_07935 [Verrucomicrobia bacterium]|nr:hypothetical protein [Verrucomicrobiota bacterium]MCF7707415.1 hypothetical protein [Verrucomicrobiota bacterium]
MPRLIKYGICVFLSIGVLASISSVSHAQEKKPEMPEDLKDVDVSKLPPPVEKEEVDFKKEIEPLIKESCLMCHGPRMAMGKFRLDAKETALKGGEKGKDIAPNIIPKHSDRSRMVIYAAGLVKGKEMPPRGIGKPLKKEQISLLRTWIDKGAEWPEGYELKAN